MGFIAGPRVTSATGGTISSITGAIVHTFGTPGSQTFIPKGNGTVDVLVVAGGGGGTGSLGANEISGGGGGSNGATTNNVSGTGGSGIVIIRYSSNCAAPTSTTGNPQILYNNGYQIYIWTSSGSVTF